MNFFLGTHMPHWLRELDIPLFVSHRRLRRYRGALPRARASWALDSGGFTELSMHGGWVTPLTEYVEAVHRYRDEIGHLQWAAPMDWMCEPHIVELTGMSVREHQERTVGNYLELRETAPGLPFVPVLQGYAFDDYITCLDLYQQAGVDLSAAPVVGVGSVCRRQGTDEIQELIRGLAENRLELHGFGVKSRGLTRMGQHLASADSMAWSFNARRNPPLPHCTHARCSNCVDYAVRWRERLLSKVGAARSQSPGSRN
jgi:hypothetical protein